ncbi:protein Flattop [Brienomyrus brachyistius]|uniref:protein Flattop n=1 Tax=Brienomyrus brachyistius TaxID=42636 RepID=UPI0020B21842|nr:protein Flattop [Brienomyrus brachyistius]XP_048880027.1 protein Flattop [Brienomyrus brachyistius]
MIPLSTTQRSMASSFSANQYENAFKSQRLQNWTLPKASKERPRAMDGHTTFIATDKGHLLPGMKAKRGDRWTFVGTWDLPTRIPPARINPTARSQEGQERLKCWGQRQQCSRNRVPSQVYHETGGSAGDRGADSHILENTQMTPEPREVEQMSEPSPDPEVRPSSSRPASKLGPSSSRQQVEAQPGAEAACDPDVN